MTAEGKTKRRLTRAASQIAAALCMCLLLCACAQPGGPAEQTPEQISEQPPEQTAAAVQSSESTPATSDAPDVQETPKSDKPALYFSGEQPDPQDMDFVTGEPQPEGCMRLCYDSVGDAAAAELSSEAKAALDETSAGDAGLRRATGDFYYLRRNGLCRAARRFCRSF